MSYTLDISKIFLDDKEYSKEIETELYQKLIDRRKLYLPYLYFQNILQKDEVCLVMKRLIEIYNNLYIDYMYDIYVNCFKVSYFYRKSDPGRCFYANYVSIDFDYMIDKVNLECLAESVIIIRNNYIRKHEQRNNVDYIISFNLINNNL